MWYSTIFQFAHIWYLIWIIHLIQFRNIIKINSYSTEGFPRLFFHAHWQSHLLWKFHRNHKIAPSSWTTECLLSYEIVGQWISPPMNRGIICNLNLPLLLKYLYDIGDKDTVFLTGAIARRLSVKNDGHRKKKFTKIFRGSRTSLGRPTLLHEGDGNNTVISNWPGVNIVRCVLKLTSCTCIYALKNNLTVYFDISRPLDLDARNFQFINTVPPLTWPSANYSRAGARARQ